MEEKSYHEFSWSLCGVWRMDLTINTLCIMPGGYLDVTSYGLQRLKHCCHLKQRFTVRSMEPIGLTILIELVCLSAAPPKWLSRYIKRGVFKHIWIQAKESSSWNGT
jgi:hypothetical protein